LFKIWLISSLAKLFPADFRQQVQLRRIRLIFGGLGVYCWRNCRRCCQ